MFICFCLAKFSAEGGSKKLGIVSKETRWLHTFEKSMIYGLILLKPQVETTFGTKVLKVEIPSNAREYN